MSRPPEEERVGRALDRAFDRMGVTWDPEWRPTMVKPKRWRTVAVTAVAGVAAAVTALLIPGGPNRLERHRIAVQLPLTTSAALPQAVARLVQNWHGQGVDPDGLVPAYGAYPLLRPTGDEMTLTGRFHVDGVSGTRVALLLSRGENHVLQGVLFSHQNPVLTYQAGGAHRAELHVVHPAPAPTALAGQWSKAGNVQLQSFTASGPLVYATHGPDFTVLTGLGTAYWNPPPGRGAFRSATIAGLPSDPSQALLLETDAQGFTQGYVTADQGQHWVPWALGHVRAANLVSMQHRFWAIINGNLEESPQGTTWHRILTVNDRRWQVANFAVNPQNPAMVVASLVPIAGNGIGPVLVTHDNGRHWNVIPDYPTLGLAPTDLSVLPNGNVVGLVALARPVLVEYHHLRHAWQIIRVPRQASVRGTGDLTAAPDGNLLYGAPGGTIYRWAHEPATWQAISPPSGVRPGGGAPTPLEAIGDQQVMASYPGGWYYFVVSPGEVTGEETISGAHGPRHPTAQSARP